MAEELWQLLGLYLLAVNVAAFLLMGADKGRARRGVWRVPERSLFLPALLGGALGGVLGMQVFRHKTRHWSPAADRAAGRTALAGPEGGGVKRPGPLCRTLPPGVVDGVFPGEDDLRDGHKGVPLLEQGLNDGGQGLRGVQGGVVEQNDGPRLHF